MAKQRQKSHNRFYVDGHDVFLYKRSGTVFWWCGFHSDGQIIRSSTKETDRKLAITFSKKWYYKKKGEIDNGLYVVKKFSFEKVTKLALDEYQKKVDRNERSKKTLDGIVSIVNSRVLPYLKDVDIKKIDNQVWQNYKKKILIDYPNTTHGTFHQYKNGVRVVLNHAFQNNLINELPEFKDDYQSSRSVKPRPPFSPSEYNKLHRAIKKHSDDLRKKNKIVQAENALELYDFVIFGTNTGMRVEELMSMKFSDVTVVEEIINNEKHKILHIQNIRGKSGTGSCKSYIGAYSAFERVIKRRKINDYKKSDEKVFLIKHRVLFNEILNKEDLKIAKTNPPRKRDFVSLRSTYINFRLLNGVSIQDIAFNCRNSVEVIQKNYAKDFGGLLLKDINKTRTTNVIWES
jgi:integrase